MRLSDVFERHVLKAVNVKMPAARVGRKPSLLPGEALRLIFRVLRTGMQWRELECNVHFTTVFKRMKTWSEAGVFTDAYTKTLEVYRKLNKNEYYCVDSSYVKNKFGRKNVTGKNHTDRGRQALKLSAIVDQNGIIHGACTHPGNIPDVSLLDETLRSAFVSLDKLPLLADRGYDSRKNRRICEQHGLQDRIFRRKTKTVRRTNARRIVVEHVFAWLDQFRRLLYMYEQNPTTYISFVLLAMGHILGNRLLYPT